MLINLEPVNTHLSGSLHAFGQESYHGREERCAELGLIHQVQQNTSMLGTPFTVTVDYLPGCTTGVSAHDRAATIRALSDPNSKPEDFGRPGHINPLYAKSRGVLQRAGHTEAAVP